MCVVSISHLPLHQDLLWFFKQSFFGGIDFGAESEFRIKEISWIYFIVGKEPWYSNLFDLFVYETAATQIHLNYNFCSVYVSECLGICGFIVFPGNFWVSKEVPGIKHFWHYIIKTSDNSGIFLL